MPPIQPQQTREQFLEALFKLQKQDNFLEGRNAFGKFLSGINKGVRAIASSYGSHGSNALIPADFRPFYTITNDGKAILDNIHLGDEIEEQALNVLRDITSKTERESGDGRKSAVLIAGAILKESEDLEDYMAVKRSLEECLPIISKEIDGQSKDVSLDDIKNIATISSENEMIGQKIKEIYEKIGVDGVIEIDNSNLPETFYEITEGVRLKRCGFMFPYMANADRNRTAIYHNPKIAIIKEKLINPSQLDKLMKGCIQNKVLELVLFVDDIDLSVSQQLAVLHNGISTPDGGSYSLKTLVIKAPTIYKDILFEDFAKITEATIIDPSVGTSLKTFSMSWLGSCEKISTTKEETIVTGIKDITDHLKVLTESGKDVDKMRLFYLRTKTAILKLGANSDTELSHLKAKASDARNSAYLALQGGSVVGGGIALTNIITKLPDTIGGKILRKALTKPLHQIMENAKIKQEDIDNLIAGKEIQPLNYGFNSKTMTYGDLRKAGVLDPTIVVKNSVTNAISVASTALTTRLIIEKQK